MEGFYGHTSVKNEPFFPTPNLITNLKKANGIKGRTFRIKGGYYYLGSKTFAKLNKDVSVGFVFIPNIGDSKLVKMLGIKCLCRDNDIVVVLMPSIKIEDVSFKNILYNHFVVQESLEDALDLKTYKLPVEQIIRPLIECDPSGAAIKIFGAVDNGSYYTVEIYGQRLELTDSNFLLFLRFVAGVFRNEDKWVSVQDLAREGIVTEDGYKQTISRLRRKLQDCVGNKAKDLIENGRKKYRLKVNSDKIEFDASRLREIKNARIQAVVDKLK